MGEEKETVGERKRGGWRETYMGGGVNTYIGGGEEGREEKDNFVKR